jgi:HSF-type DNA-binding
LMLILMHMDKVSREGVPPVQWWPNTCDETDNSILVVNNPQVFTSVVLPMFCFPPSSFESFIRKMYRWGFRRAKKPGRWAFVCSNFQRDDFRLMAFMYSADGRLKTPKIHVSPAKSVTTTGLVDGDDFATGTDHAEYAGGEGDTAFGKPLRARKRSSPLKTQERVSKLPRVDVGGVVAVRDKISPNSLAFKTKRSKSSQLDAVHSRPGTNWQPSAGVLAGQRTIGMDGTIKDDGSMGPVFLDTPREDICGEPRTNFPPLVPPRDPSAALENHGAATWTQHQQPLEMLWSGGLSTPTSSGFAELKQFLLAEQSRLESQLQQALLALAVGLPIVGQYPAPAAQVERQAPVDLTPWTLSMNANGRFLELVRAALRQGDETH